MPEKEISDTGEPYRVGNDPDGTCTIEKWVIYFGWIPIAVCLCETAAVELVKALNREWISA